MMEKKDWVGGPPPTRRLARSDVKLKGWSCLAAVKVATFELRAKVKTLR